MTSAAQRGVAVRLVNSGAIDLVLVGYAQRSFYDALLKAGVEIRLFPAPVLLHAKAMVVDETVAVAGSSNFDMRSFTLNMEVSTILYDTTSVRRVAAVLDGYAAASAAVDLASRRDRPFRTRILETVARLTAALQ